MAILNTGQQFASGDQVTSQKLMDIAGLATFDDPADESTIKLDSTTGKLKVPASGITSTELATDSVTTTKIKDNAVTSDKLAANAISAILPTGTVMPFAGSSAPTGFLFCDGREYSETGTYSNLFSVIGSFYTKNNETAGHFRVPDLQGRVVAGRDNMSGTSADRLTTSSAANIDGVTLGATGGDEEHTLLSSESGLPDHTHPNGARDGSSGDIENLAPNGGEFSTSGSVTGGAQDASAAHNNVQPTIILNYIIKT